MMTLIQEIYAKREVSDESGVAYPLHSEITRDEGDLVTTLISQNGCRRTLEVGCAYGLSSLYICGAIPDSRGEHHTIVDPYQRTEWKGIGILNLHRAGYDSFRLLEQPSEMALPDLIRAGERFDFVLIDGFHTFDQTLVDFYFVNRLLELGGIVVFDDVHLPAVRRVARFVARRTDYRVRAGARPFCGPPSAKRRVAEALFRLLAAGLPTPTRHEVFADSLFTGDYALGIGYEMVAFQRIAEDDRGTHSFTIF
jgi:predicted O-methyltransferase YrrM